MLRLSCVCHFKGLPLDSPKWWGCLLGPTVEGQGVRLCDQGAPATSQNPVPRNEPKHRLSKSSHLCFSPPHYTRRNLSFLTCKMGALMQILAPFRPVRALSENNECGKILLTINVINDSFIIIYGHSIRFLRTGEKKKTEQ